MGTADIMGRSRGWVVPSAPTLSATKPVGPALPWRREGQTGPRRLPGEKPLSVSPQGSGRQGEARTTMGLMPLPTLMRTASPRGARKQDADMALPVETALSINQRTLMMKRPCSQAPASRKTDYPSSSSRALLLWVSVQ